MILDFGVRFYLRHDIVFVLEVIIISYIGWKNKFMTRYVHEFSFNHVHVKQ